MAVGIALLGVAALVGAWSTRAVPASAGGAVPPTFLVGMVGENDGSSWWNMNCHSTEEDLVANKLFCPTLVMGLEAVPALGLNLDVGERRTWLQHRSKGQPCVQS